MATLLNRGLLVLGLILLLIGLALHVVNRVDGQPDQTAVFSVEKARLIGVINLRKKS